MIQEQEIWQEIIERFEQQTPGAVMAHLALDRVLPLNWIDEVFQGKRLANPHSPYPGFSGKRRLCPPAMR